MLKRLTAFLLSLTILFLCSCTKSSDDNEQSSAPTTQPYDIRITFSDGLTADEYAQILEENNICSASDFLSAVNSPVAEYWFINEIDNPSERPFLLEGYLYPDTYCFRYNTDAQEVLNTFLDNFDKKISEDIKAQADEMNLTVDEVLTLASIIREEATDPEMRNVSSVLHNRINSSYGKLECDVTIFYLNEHIKPYADVEKYKEYYNTYKVRGLPAGPITNTGIDAIKAALYPADTDFYFFVYDEDMNYYYAVTWEEHSANVKKYYKK